MATAGCQVSEAMTAFSQDGCRGIVLGYTSQLRATGQFVLSRWRRQLACTLDYDATILRPAGRTQPAGRRSSKGAICAATADDELVCEPLLMGRGSIHDLQTALIDAVAVAALTAHATAQAGGGGGSSSQSKLRGVREHRSRAAEGAENGAAAGAGLGSPPPPPPAGWCSWYELGTHVR